MRRIIAPLLPLLLLCGCGASLVNPSFPITTRAATEDWRRMCETPAPAQRPLLIVSGYADPGFAASDLKHRLGKVLGPDATIITADVGYSFSMEAARDRVIAAVQKALPGGDARETAEVDMIGVSLGGLVGRYAATPREGGPRLRVAHLYTISSPHRGARWAAIPSWEPRVQDMRVGSPFLCRLDACGLGGCGGQIVPYVRLDDSIVGVENAAPTGMTPWWVPTPPLEASHLLAHSDPRILADIARRLRGEEPLTHEPAAPLPGAKPRSST